MNREQFVVAVNEARSHFDKLLTADEHRTSRRALQRTTLAQSASVLGNPVATEADFDGANEALQERIVAEEVSKDDGDFAEKLASDRQRLKDQAQEAADARKAAKTGTGTAAGAPAPATPEPAEPPKEPKKNKTENPPAAEK